MNEIGVAIIELLRQFVTAAGPSSGITVPPTTTTSEVVTLSLGTRKDPLSWEKGCRDLGFTIGASTQKPEPTLDELKLFFKSTPTWVYFGGHFGGDTLFNEPKPKEPTIITVRIKFGPDGVVIRIDDVDISDATPSVYLDKGTPDFQLERNLEVMLWGGCDVFTREKTIRNIRLLFNNPLLLGFKGTTGIKIVNAVLGGSFIRNHFFKRIGDNKADLVAVRNAWMETARYGYGGGEYEDNFRALDPDGQEWKLREKKIVKGRKIL